MRVLFVGHSMLYFGPNGNTSLSVESVFVALAQQGGQDISVTASYIGGGTLKNHWDDTSGINARTEIATGDYDVVMLCGSLGDTAFSPYADMFSDLATAQGADVMFYGLWPGDWETSIAGGTTQALRDQSYVDAALRNDAALVPNFDTYAAVYKELTRLYGNGDDGTTAENMLTVDSIHATALGAYVIANTMYYTYFQQTPPPASVWRPAGVSLADAELVQRIVAETVGERMIPLDSRDASISGVFFVDADADGLNEGDDGLAGQTVTLLQDGVAIATTVTDDQGAYLFAQLAAGDYQVQFGPLTGKYAFVPPNAGDDALDSDALPEGTAAGEVLGLTDIITLTRNATVADIDAGVEAVADDPGIQTYDPADYDQVRSGTDQADFLVGSTDGDMILGLEGDDLISARPGDDYVDGGLGQDTLNGGAGSDVFVFDALDLSINGGSGIDRVLLRGGGLTDARQVRLSSVEILDMANGAIDDVMLSYLQVRNAGETELRIVAEAGDTVRIDTDREVTFLGSVSESGQIYDRYQVGLATFGIDADADLLIGTQMV